MSPDLEAQLRHRFSAVLPPTTTLDIPDDRLGDIEWMLGKIARIGAGHHVRVIEITERGGMLSLHVRCPTAPRAVRKAIYYAARNGRFQSWRRP
jgi:hypothetical protein